MSYCAQCGAAMAEGYTACPRCRATAPAVPGRTDGTAVASLVLGILGFVACPLVASVLAIVLGNQARARIAGDPGLDGEPLARAGVILGWVGLGLVGASVALGLLLFILPFGFGFFL